MKQISLVLVLCLMLGAGCEKKPAGAAVGAESTAVTPGADSSAARVEPQREKRVAVDSLPAGGTLAGLRDMSLEQGMAIDDLRGRLEHDWGDVHSILLASGGSFQPEGEGYLVLKGEVKQGQFPWGAILIVDLAQDAVFAAQYDGENKRFDQFEEEKEGLRQPAPLTAWMKTYR